MPRSLHILLALVIVSTNTLCLCAMSVSPVEPTSPAVSCCASDPTTETPAPAHPVDCDICKLHRADDLFSAAASDLRLADANLLFVHLPVAVAVVTLDPGLLHPAEVDPPPLSHLNALSRLGRFLL